jgi:tRNA pseudouridine55 synthase
LQAAATLDHPIGKFLMNGILIVDKPTGPTSHDVVSRVRKILQQRSVGHLGTLDPLATGVLPLVLGNFTRLAQFYLSSEKNYAGVMRFGYSTDTYDAEGEASSPVQAIALSLESVRQLAARFRGVTEQMPPPFSAKKIQGVPAYKLARRKADVQLKAVKVEIKELEILDVEGERVQFRVRVAAGTYVRSLAHDMGQQMGCGAHLESLRRTASGEFELADARTLEEIEAAAKSGNAEDLFIHPRKLLPQFPCVTANEETTAYIRNGRAVNLPEFSAVRMVKVFRGQRELVALATRVAGTLFHPEIVMAADQKVKLVKQS